MKRIDRRIAIVSNALKNKDKELDASSDNYYNLLATETIKALDVYYGAAIYWMAAEFERERVLNELEAAIDRIRNASFYA